MHISRMRYFQKTKSVWKRILCFPVALCVCYFVPSSVRFLIGCIPMDKCALESGEMLILDDSVDASLDLRYLDTYLETFLRSSERHFMLGLPVSYYVFTDAPDRVPRVELGAKRNLKVIKVQKHSRWQDVSMMRMKAISDAIESDIRHCCTHVFCMDVDQAFTGRFGSEALGDSVALLHAYYYHLPKWLFTYDRNPSSKAYVKDGDFYYHAAVFGGSWRSVKALTKSCYENIVEDKRNNVEARWHDESHLNKYFWLHKPSRVLSPEYCWDPRIGYRKDIQVARLQWAPKHYDTLRQS